MKNPIEEFLQRREGKREGRPGAPAGEKLTLTFIAVASVAMIAALSQMPADTVDNTVKALFIVGITIGGYFLPSILAGARGHHNVLAIFLLNLLLGWTGLGWIAALIWAATAVSRPAKETA